jgi:hypothetical protein
MAIQVALARPSLSIASCRTVVREGGEPMMQRSVNVPTVQVLKDRCLWKRMESIQHTSG